MTWTAGQQAVISRQTVVTIERVTPAGRAIANGRTFEADGRERKAGSHFSRARLELITPEIQAEMDLAQRARAAKDGLWDAIHAVDRWYSGTFGGWRRPDSLDADDVDRAERLAAAILGNLPPPADAETAQ